MQIDGDLEGGGDGGGGDVSPDILLLTEGGEQLVKERDSCEGTQSSLGDSRLAAGIESPWELETVLGANLPELPSHAESLSCRDSPPS